MTTTNERPRATGPAGQPSTAPLRDALRPFGADELDELVQRVGATSYPAGATVLAAGESITDIGIVVDGQVELVRRTGGRRVVLQVLHTGDVIGDIPFLCRLPAPFDVKTLRPSRIVHLDVDLFWKLLVTRPHVCQRFLFSMASRVERLQRRFVELTGSDLRQRVATLLLDEHTDVPGPIELTQAKVAEMIASTRQSVNQVLRELEQDGMIRRDYRTIHVLEPEALRALVDR
jgi:CRP/FNR family transcriptional regulator, cAMP and macrophage regulator